MIKGLMITPPVIGRISIGKVVEKNGKRLPEKDDEFTITTQVQQRGHWVLHPLDEALRRAQEHGGIKEGAQPSDEENDNNARPGKRTLKEKMGVSADALWKHQVQRDANCAIFRCACYSMIPISTYGLTTACLTGALPALCA